MSQVEMAALRHNIAQLQNQLAEWSHDWRKEPPLSIRMGDELVPDLSRAVWLCRKCEQKVTTQAVSAGYHAPTPAAGGHDTKCPGKPVDPAAQAAKIADLEAQLSRLRAGQQA